ncbi:DUF5709 domain-containing protein [Streptomyces qinglanensis]|uniref:DUF5709 domain-containing protein n=1 Tax=Streptomyces qinglanensis TaxID=943816 RepID=A0A1H9TDJ5_9ACTN|nr:DUF5709 domain-containing protein [Streptomyces qinglanensis]SER95107.1 hypothetical protein SAMN05421870_10631 [Streptomyces qinglanensis]
MTGDGRDIPAEEGVTIEDAAELRPGPVAGREPGERLERGHWQPPVESDPPPRVAGDDSGGFDTSFLTPQAEAEQEHAEPADPGAEPEDEGIPDLQDGAPMQQRSSDPQQEAVPGDTPTAVTRAAPTPAEMRAGESLDERLAEEEPEESERKVVSGLPDALAGALRADLETAPPRRQDVYGREAGESEGLSPEERALRTVDEDEM